MAHLMAFLNHSFDHSTLVGFSENMVSQILKEKHNKLRWYPQQPQRFIFTNLSEACCEAKRWKHLSWVSVY
jgi:hypothetical protein